MLKELFMKEDLKDWTDKALTITDIRKVSEFYIFTVKGLNAPLMVKDKIFEERMKTYYLSENYRFTREDVTRVKWNMYITKGYYVKICRGDIQKYPMDEDKFYVSYLEIDGPLGGFHSVCKDKETI